MAGDKVKKGFAFYLLMFILLIVAVFLGILTFMLFSPQKDVLGFKYFSFSESEQVVQTTAKEDINFSSLNEIRVNAKKASVNVLKSNVDKDTIEFVNNSIGFARSEQNTVFTRELILDKMNGILTINVTEPEGFLHFSNNVEVNILVPSEIGDKEDEKSINYNQLLTTKLTISTDSGNVSLGLSSSDKEEMTAYNTIAPSNIDIRTGSGSIKFNKYITSRFSNINLVTGSGSISSEVGLTIMGNNGTNKISTSNGKINISTVTMTGYAWTADKEELLNVNIGNGTFNCDKFLGTISVVTTNGNVNINELSGHFSANNTKDFIEAPSFNIKKVGGDVSIPHGNNAKIEIGQVDGYINIDLNGGKAKVGAMKGINDRSWISTDSGIIEAYVADEKLGVIHNFESNNGEINVTFTSEIRSHTSILSNTGNVNLSIRSGYKFLLEVKTTDGKYVETLNDKVSFEFIDSKEYKMPFGVHGYTGTASSVLIQTNGQVRGKLLPLFS